MDVDVKEMYSDMARVWLTTWGEMGKNIPKI